MRRLARLLAIVLGTASLSFCRAGDLAAPPVIDGPRFTYDCTLGPFLCNQIDGAITRLEQSTNSNCQFAGNMARLRFEAEGYGYRPADRNIAPFKDAYVLMQEVPTNYSQWGPTDYNTYVHVSFFSRTQAQQAGVIADEEMHQAGWDNPGHTTGYSDSYNDQCSN